MNIIRLKRIYLKVMSILFQCYIKVEASTNSPITMNFDEEQINQVVSYTFNEVL